MDATGAPFAFEGAGVSGEVDAVVFVGEGAGEGTRGVSCAGAADGTILRISVHGRGLILERPRANIAAKY